jgi:hypothetical protein
MNDSPARPLNSMLCHIHDTRAPRRLLAGTDPSTYRVVQWTTGNVGKSSVGRPTIKTTLSFLPPQDFQGETLDDYIRLGLTVTAMPAITAIPAVVSAAPGIATYNDLPLLLPRGVLRPNR